MREIKFRSWNTKTKRMLQVHEIYFKQNVIHSYNPNAKKGDREYGIFFPASLIESGNFAKNAGFAILMQYTGLKDKNGKEIYEGDICKGYGFYDEPNEYHKDAQIGVCKFQAGSFVIENINHTTIRGGEVTLKYKVEVIGNIYENPELLK